MINIKYINEVYLQVQCEKSISMELWDHFSYPHPNPSFIPSYQNKMWDGIIRLYNLKTNMIYAGLRQEIKLFAKKMGYSYNEDAEFSANPFSIYEAQNFISELAPTMQPRDYQLVSFIKAIRNKRQLFVSPTNCHAKGDKVLMYEGCYRNIENIKIGDYVIGADGLPKKVLNIFSGKSELYEIKTSKNKKNITVTADHILPIRFSDSNEKYGYCKGNKDFIEYISVKDYINKSDYYKHCSKLVYNNKEILFKECHFPNINLSPYFIGLYLGDGSSYRCAITTKDKEIVEETLIQAKNNNCIVSTKDDLHYFITGSKNRSNNIFTEFKKLGLYFSGKNRLKCEERFIPKILFNTPIEYRYELLAGLIDSDGYLSNNTYYEFCSKSKQLADDVYFLSISLGLVPTFSHKTINNVHYYRVNICGNINKIPVRIYRKKQTNINNHRNAYNSSFTIIKKETNEYYGIQVEDALYITNGGMITHNSGKSFIIFLILQYLQKKTLIVVPTTSLILQMTGDFLDYDSKKDIDLDIHHIYDGKSQKTDKRITISTWQSIYDNKPGWFSQFHTIIGDEVHRFKADSLVSMMKKTIRCPYKLGFTGTLDNVEINEMTIEGLFGRKVIVTTNKELIDRKISADILIKSIVLDYPKEDRLAMHISSYEDEVDFLISLQARNNFIANLANSLDGNVLVLFRYVERHGDLLWELLQKKNKNRSGLYYVHGQVDTEYRNSIRTEIEQQNNAIILASLGTFSTGINIKRIDHIIFATPTKSRVNVLQSIGRGLRRSEIKEQVTLFDISDDLSYNGINNTTLRHYKERLTIYDQEQFPYKQYKVKINT